MKRSATDHNLADLHELSQQLSQHVKLLRDYATTPGDLWLARAELAKAAGLISELESLLAKIERG